MGIARFFKETVEVAYAEDRPNFENFDLVVANIQADVLMQNSETLIQLVRKDGFLVLSGILTNEMELVEDCFLNLLQMKEKNFETDKKSLGEWSLLQLRLIA